MKQTIESFDSKIKVFEAKRAEINADIAELSRKEASLAQECKAAVEAGDVETYIQKNREKDDVTAALFVKRSFLDKMGKAVSEADAKEAWASYVTNYNKEMLKALEDFEKAKATLLTMYKNLADYQAAALKVRNHLNEYAGVANPDRSFPMQFIPCLSGVDGPGKLSKGNLNASDPDLLYYIANKEKAAGKSIFLNPNTAEAIDVNYVSTVVVQHKA